MLAGQVAAGRTSAAPCPLRGPWAPRKRPHGPPATGAFSVVGQSIGHSPLRGVDPDDVQVAIVDALLVLVGETRAASGSVTHRAPLSRLLPKPTWSLLLPRAVGTWTLCCDGDHGLPNVPLRSGCRVGLGYAAPTSFPRLGTRHQSCGRGHCEPKKEPQPQLHEPRSGAGAPGLEDALLWPRKGSGAGSSGPHPPAVGLQAAAQSLGPGSRQELAAAVTNFRARYPSLHRAGRLWAQAFLAPAPPPRLPAPRRGWSCRAGPLNPGSTGGLLLGEGGAGPESTQHSEGRGSSARRGAVRWGPGQLPGGHANTHTHSHTDTRTHRHRHTRALTPCPLLCCPRSCSSPPLEE